MPPLPEAIILALAPLAPLFSRRVWRHAQLLLLGAILTPGARTVTAALRAMGLAAERRRPQAQQTVNKQLRNQSTDEVKAFQQLWRTAFACAADAQQALNTLAHGPRATAVLEVTVRATPRYHTRGRPGQGTPPAQVVDQIEGALASSIMARAALVAQQRCCILATNALDDTL